MTPLIPACVCAKVGTTTKRTKDKTLENLRQLIVPPFFRADLLRKFCEESSTRRQISNKSRAGTALLSQEGSLSLGRCQFLAQRLCVEFPFPARYDQCCHSISDHIYRGAEHAHEPVDAENQGHTGNWDSRDDHQRSHQCDEGCALNSAGAFRG